MQRVGPYQGRIHNPGCLSYSPGRGPLVLANRPTKSRENKSCSGGSAPSRHHLLVAPSPSQSRPWSSHHSNPCARRHLDTQQALHRRQWHPAVGAAALHREHAIAASLARHVSLPLRRAVTRRDTGPWQHAGTVAPACVCPPVHRQLALSPSLDVSSCLPLQSVTEPILLL